MLWIVLAALAMISVGVVEKILVNLGSAWWINRRGGWEPDRNWSYYDKRF